MKKLYLRSYGYMENQPESKKVSELYNHIVLNCVNELKSQGVDIEMLPFGDKRLLEYTEYCVPQKYSKIKKMYMTLSFKLKRKLFEFKLKQQCSK